MKLNNFVREVVKQWAPLFNISFLIRSRPAAFVVLSLLIDCLTSSSEKGLSRLLSCDSVVFLYFNSLNINSCFLSRFAFSSECSFWKWLYSLRIGTVESSELSTWFERDFRVVQKLSGCLVLTSSSILLSRCWSLIDETNLVSKIHHYQGRIQDLFLGGGAPIRNGVTDWWTEVNTSCIRKPQVISRRGEGGGCVHIPCTLPLDPALITRERVPSVRTGAQIT